MPIKGILNLGASAVYGAATEAKNLITSGITALGDRNNPLAPLTEPVVGRLRTAGLWPGATRLGPATTEVKFFNGDSSEPIPQDWKVKITLSDTNPYSFLADGIPETILYPLLSVNGVIFPYTPQITVSHQSNYSPQKFIHGNYNHMSYENSEVAAITISGEFTAQNRFEADYVLACIYFFRAATKMYFGKSKGAGQPPPLVYLSGYGKHYFPKVPCVITQFSHVMPQDVDYIETNGKFENSSTPSVDIRYGDDTRSNFINETTKVPTTSTITVILQPVYSKKTMTQFNLQEFAKGKLISRGYL